MINVITNHEISVLCATLKDAKSMAIWGDDESLMSECQKCLEMLRTLKPVVADKVLK